MKHKEIVKILVKTDSGHCHVMGRRGEGKSSVVSEVVDKIKDGRRTFVIKSENNRFGKVDFLVPLINQLGITKKTIRRFRGTKVEACQNISTMLSTDDVIVFEDIGRGNIVTGAFYFPLN